MTTLHLLSFIKIFCFGEAKAKVELQLILRIGLSQLKIINNMMNRSVMSTDTTKSQGTTVPG